jgi:hypothetical protein
MGATAKSGLPSALKSPAATAIGCMHAVYADFAGVLL